MIETTDDKVIFSRELWEELKQDNYFHELIEIIIDREDLKDSMLNVESTIDYDEYRKNRLAKINV